MSALNVVNSKIRKSRKSNVILGFSHPNYYSTLSPLSHICRLQSSKRQMAKISTSSASFEFSLDYLDSREVQKATCFPQTNEPSEKMNGNESTKVKVNRKGQHTFFRIFTFSISTTMTYLLRAMLSFHCVSDSRALWHSTGGGRLSDNR